MEHRVEIVGIAPVSHDEIWLPVVGFENSYLISNYGRVYSLPRMIRRKPDKVAHQHPGTGRLMRVHSNGDGYLDFQAYRDNVAYLKYVHSTVCEAFHGPRPENHQAAHLNGVSTDNRASNLQWVTPQENQSHRRIHGTDCVGEKSAMAKFTNAEVGVIRARREKGEQILIMAREYGVHPATLSRICSGQSYP